MSGETQLVRYEAVDGVSVITLDRQPVNAYVCTVSVTAIDDTIKAIPSYGGTIALAKMPVPGIGWLAYGKDTEGNLFGVMQPDPTAK